MGNVNEQQEHDANSQDGVNSSNSEEDSSSSSIAISEQDLLGFFECLSIETNNAASPTLQHTDSSIVATNNESENAGEVSRGNTCDDSFPLSDSAIPECFSPIPSDTSDAFHTPNLSQSDIEDNEAYNELNSPLCTAQPESEQEEDKLQQEATVELTGCAASTSTDSVEIEHLVPIENLDRRREADLDLIGPLRLQTPYLDGNLTDISEPVEDLCMLRVPTPSDSECIKYGPLSKIEPVEVVHLVADAENHGCKSEAELGTVGRSSLQTLDLQDDLMDMVAVEDRRMPRAPTSKFKDNGALSEIEPVQLLNLVPGISNLCKSEVGSGTIGQAREQIPSLEGDLTNIAAMENCCMHREPTPSVFECRENTTSKVESLETSSNRSGSPPGAELQTEIPMEGSPVVEPYDRQNTLLSFDTTNTPKSVPNLADEVPCMEPPESVIEIIEGGGKRSLSDQARLENKTRDLVPLAETLPVLSRAVSTTLAISLATPLKVQNQVYEAPIKLLTDALIVPSTSSRAASPPQHTADRPNWALAPESPPRAKVASLKMRRKRARGGKQVNTDPFPRNPDSLRSSSLGGAIDTTKSKTKWEQPPYIGSSGFSSTKATNTVASTCESLNRSELTASVNEGFERLPSTARLAEGVAQYPKRDASTFSVPPAATGSPRIRERAPDTSALPAPILVQTIAALEQNTNQHRNMKADVNRISIMDEAVNVCYPVSKSDQPQGNRSCPPVNSTHTKPRNISKRDTSSVSMQFNQAGDQSRVFEPLTLSSVDILDRSSPHRSPSRRGIGSLPTITEDCLVQERRGKETGLPNSYRTSPKNGSQHGINDVASLKSLGENIMVVSESQKPNENLVPSVSPPFPVMSMASRQHKRLSWPVLKDELRYGSSERPLLLHRGSAFIGSVSHSLSPKSTSLSTPTEPENPLVYKPDGLVAATGSQHVAFDDSMEVGGKFPTPRVNLPTKRSQSLDSARTQEDNGYGHGHGHQSSFQSGIPVLTKKYGSKTPELNAEPVLIPRAIRSMYAQGDRVSPRVSALGSSVQNTCHTSGLTQTKRVSPHPYPRHTDIGTATRSRRAFAVNRNISFSQENRSRSLEFTPVEPLRGTHTNTAAPIYLYPPGSSQSQIPFHYQHSTAYRTRYEELQGNQQPGELISLDQLENVGFKTEFIRETSILHVPPLRRQRQGLLHRAKDDTSTLN